MGLLLLAPATVVPEFPDVVPAGLLRRLLLVEPLLLPLPEPLLEEVVALSDPEIVAVDWPPPGRVVTTVMTFGTFVVELDPLLPDDDEGSFVTPFWTTSQVRTKGVRLVVPWLVTRSVWDPSGSVPV